MGLKGAFRGALGRPKGADNGRPRGGAHSSYNVMTYAHMTAMIPAMETRCYTSTMSSKVRIHRSPEILSTVRLVQLLMKVEHV